MKMVKMVLLAGISGTLTSVSVFATPLDITLTGGSPYVEWGPGSVYGNDVQYEDVIPGSEPGQINLAGVNSIQVTWQAPAGYMYVYTPAPADVAPLTLQFEVAYGPEFSSSSLGSVTSQSMSVNTVYGSSPVGGPIITTASNPDGALVIGARGQVGTGDPFAFTSLTILANFSGTGSGTLDLDPYDQISGYFGVLYGLPFVNEYSGSASDPGPLLTLEPLPTASTPDNSSTLSLAGIGFAGLFLFGRRRLAVNG